MSFGINNIHIDEDYYFYHHTTHFNIYVCMYVVSITSCLPIQKYVFITLSLV